MSSFSWVLIAVVVIGLVFDYTNGFHDSANAIATSIGTRALTPATALAMAAILNVVGGLIYPTAVANTMTQIVSQAASSQTLVLAALSGAIIWNLITWYYGIPSSSSHALIGGLIGAALGATFSLHEVKWGAVWSKVIIPTVASPLIGFLAATMVTTILYRLVNNGTDAFEKVIVRTLGFSIFTAFFAFILHLLVGEPVKLLAHKELPWWPFLPFAGALSIWTMLGVIGRGPSEVNGRFRFLQTLSAGFMALEHGHNDAQKTMGIITIGLIAEGIVAKSDHPIVPLWVKLACATCMGLGTFTGGKRIIRTMGMKLVRLEPIDGFAAETVAGSVINVAGSLGMPISTTHAITASITGVGATKRMSAVHWEITGRILTAWVLTLPAAAILAAASWFVFRLLPH